MANDYENMIRLFLRSKQDPRLAGTLDTLGTLMESAEGQNLMRLISQGGADVLKTASDAALRGDKAAAKTAMTRLLSTKEGMAFATKLADLVSERRS